jgi:hypothetical protein
VDVESGVVGLSFPKPDRERRGVAMAAPIVSLRRVVDELEALFEGYTAYLHRRTGELVTVSDDELRAAEEESDDDAPEWERDLILKAREILSDGDFLRLPDKFDLHEHQIMRRFCDSLEDEELSSELHSLLHGSGAFRRFKDAVDRYGMTDDWYRFRAGVIEEVARDWLEENEIPYAP